MSDWRDPRDRQFDPRIDIHFDVWLRCISEGCIHE